MTDYSYLIDDLRYMEKTGLGISSISSYDCGLYADALEDLSNQLRTGKLYVTEKDTEKLIQLCIRRKKEGSVPWKAGSAESRNALLEVQRIDDLIVETVLEIFKNYE